MYLPGVGMADILNGNTWNTGVATAYQTNGRAFMNHVNALITGATTWKLCAVSYYRTVNGVIQYKQPPEVYLISDVVMHTRVDSMRRRLGKETV